MTIETLECRVSNSEWAVLGRYARLSVEYGRLLVNLIAPGSSGNYTEIRIEVPPVRFTDLANAMVERYARSAARAFEKR
jgi:hypothetical protein